MRENEETYTLVNGWEIKKRPTSGGRCVVSIVDPEFSGFAKYVKNWVFPNERRRNYGSMWYAFVIGTMQQHLMVDELRRSVPSTLEYMNSMTALNQMDSLLDRSEKPMLTKVQN